MSEEKENIIGIEKDESSDNKSETKLSEDSPRQSSKVNISTNTIIINSEPTSDGLHFNLVSNIRTDTEEGKKQGDHVTAYRTFLELISAGIEHQEPADAIDSLIKMANCFLPQDNVESLQKIKEDYLTEFNEKGMSREDRKKLTAGLRISRIDEEKIQKIKNSLKMTNNVILGKYIAQISIQILSDTNQMENMTFSKSRKDKKGDEDTKIGMAIKALKSLDRLIFISNEKDEELRKEMLDEFVSKTGKEYYFLNGLNYFFKNSDSLIEEIFEKDFAEELKKISQEIKEAEKNLQENKDINKKNELKDKLKSVNEKFRKKVVEELKGDFSQYHEHYVTQILQDINFSKTMGLLLENLYDYRFVKDGDNKFSILCSTSARHVAIVFQAFKNLREYGKDKKSIIEEFLKNLLGKQGWCNHKIMNVNDEEDEKSLDLEYLFKKSTIYLNNKNFSYNHQIVEEKDNNKIFTLKN